MQTEYVESKPVQITIQSEKALACETEFRYGKHRPLRLAEQSQALRGRQLTIAYRKLGVTYGKVVQSPLAITDTFNIGVEKLRSTLLASKVNLSDVTAMSVNHGDGHEACAAIVRRAIASKS